jgi:hypothetical protein
MSPGLLHVPALAHAYRFLVLWFGVQLLVSLASAVVQRAPLTGALAIVLSLVIAGGMLATFVGLTYYGYQTAVALGSRVAWLWAIAMLVPCVNVVTLLALSSKATRACREHGIQVGLLGPRV